MTPEEHQQEHVRLHRALDVLLACYLGENRHPERTSIFDEIFDLLKWSHSKTLFPSPVPENRAPDGSPLHVEGAFLIAQNDDPELLEWLANAKQKGGGFASSIANAALVADFENYPLIRWVVLAMREKYPAYEPSDAVKQEIRDRVKP